MNRLPALLSLIIPAVVAAQDAPPIAKYVPAEPDRAHVFVMDSAHVLSAATIAALQDSALALQKETGADVAWITLPTLGGRAIEEASVYLGRAWKIGSAGAPGDPLRNRGLLILYIPDKTKTAGSNFRVEVGKGLQGTIIDSRSRSISAAMRDDLRAKRFDAAYMKGWKVAAAMVREDFTSRGIAATPPPPVQQPVTPARDPNASHPAFAAVVAVILISLFILLLWRSRGYARNGPQTMVFYPANDSSDDEESRRRSSSSSSSSFDFGSGGSSGGSSDGGSFGGGGGFDGGGSSDSI